MNITNTIKLMNCSVKLKISFYDGSIEEGNQCERSIDEKPTREFFKLNIPFENGYNSKSTDS